MEKSRPSTQHMGCSNTAPVPSAPSGAATAASHATGVDPSQGPMAGVAPAGMEAVQSTSRCLGVPSTDTTFPNPAASLPPPPPPAPRDSQPHGKQQLNTYKSPGDAVTSASAQGKRRAAAMAPDQSADFPCNHCKDPVSSLILSCHCPEVATAAGDGSGCGHEQELPSAAKKLRMSLHNHNTSGGGSFDCRWRK